MKHLHSLIYLPIIVFTLISTINISSIAFHAEPLDTGYKILNGFIAIVFSLGIHAGFLLLIIHKKRPVGLVCSMLFFLNFFYYAKGGKVYQLLNGWQPEIFSFIQATMPAILFSALLSIFAWYLPKIDKPASMQ